MNHTLTETYNEDTKIQEIQTKLYDKLIVEWSTTELDGFGRVYKNERSGKVIPEVYDATTKDYRETLYNNQSCFFFIDDDRHTSKDDIVFTTDLKVVFMLDLSKVKTSSLRVDADVKRDVISILRDFRGVFEDFEYIKGIDNVFNGFDTSRLTENDMQPLHVFAVKGTLSYFINDKCA